MPNLVIKYATKDIAAIIIDNQLYYIQFGPDVPRLFDSSLNPQIVNNLDNWIQSRTNQRYCYQSVKDMSEAFHLGLSSGYNLDDITQISKSSCLLTIHNINHTNYIYEYTLKYWIEILNYEQLESLVTKIRINFDHIFESLGQMGVSKYIGRIAKVCQYRHKNLYSVCEKMLSKTGVKLCDPLYPITDELDEEIINTTCNAVLKNLGTKYKKIPNYIVERADDLQSGRLSRT